MPNRTVPYDPTRDALYRPHLTHDFFPVKEGLPDDLLCAECSLLVYKHFESVPDEEQEARSALQSVGFDEVAWFNQGGSQAFAAWSPRSQTAVVAFRGTEEDDPTDMAHNLNTLPTPWAAGGRVHEGFKKYLDLIWSDLDSWLQAHPGRLLFTGHSLGAALGTLAASLRKPVKLVTFGSPRVGDSGFVNTLSGFDISRYVDCCDVVTRLPPPIGFVHVNQEAPVYIDQLGEIKPGATKDVIRQDRGTAREEYILHETWKWGNAAVRDLADHAPINYVYALRHQAASTAR
ncbi:MAG: lipase family protein [Acidobacteria bacterium]|nr:lipase family protein [Acidobacteriota bacterium]